MAESEGAIVTHNHETPPEVDMTERWTVVTQTPTSESQPQTPISEFQPKSFKHVVTSSPKNPPINIENCSSSSGLQCVQTVVNQIERTSAWLASEDLEMDARLARLDTKFNQLTEIMYFLASRKVRITAGEILKRAVGAKNENHGDGLHDYYKTPEVKRRLAVRLISPLLLSFVNTLSFNNPLYI